MFESSKTILNIQIVCELSKIYVEHFNLLVTPPQYSTIEKKEIIILDN